MAVGKGAENHLSSPCFFNHFIAVILKLVCGVWEPPWRLHNTLISGLHTQSFWFSKSAVGPGDADAAGPGTALWESLFYKYSHKYYFEVSICTVSGGKQLLSNLIIKNKEREYLIYLGNI